MIDEIDLYKEAIIKWGVDSQIKMAIEEMAELIQALTKYGRAVNGCSHYSVIEELIDVEIMIKQLKVMFTTGSDNYDDDYRRKLKRLENLVFGKR